MHWHANTLVLMLCISHLDYANALLYGMTKKLKSKYQRIQNMCAKLVLNKKKYDSATKCLQELHWLPIKQRIQNTQTKHKILQMTHKALSGQAPKYIQELIQIKTSCRQLRSGHSGRTLVHTKYTETNICLKVIQLCCSSTMESPTTAP